MVEQLNCAVGLPQDLKNIYVYWDFSPQRIWVLRDFMTHVKPGMKFCLRLLGFSYEKDNPALIEREIIFERIDSHGGYYFHNVKPSLNYQFELGGKDPDEFVPFTRTAMLNLHPSHRDFAPLIRIPLTIKSEWDGYHETQPTSGGFESVERSRHAEH